MLDGKADAMASTRIVLLDFSAKLAGARVLADHYGANINRMVVPKGKADWLAYVNEFIENAKASGAVQQFIDRGGTRGVTVAPLGRALFRRWPKLQLAVDESQIKWRRRPGLRAIEHLPVAVTR
jgi:hypothetical protein